MCCTHAHTRARLPGHWPVCCLPAQMSRDWQSHARARPVYLSALDARVARACMHVALGWPLLMCIMLTLLCCGRHKMTSEMTTSEMTTSETSQTSEKKYQTNACACGSRTARPRDQDSEQELSKAPRAEKPQEMCRSLRYTNELSETSKASEKKHEASGCACELQDPQAHETKSARLGPRAQESDQEHPSAADRSCAHFVPPGSGRRRPRCSPTRR